MQTEDLSAEELEKQFYQGALNSGTDVALIADSILHVNRGFASLTGHERADDGGFVRMLLVTRSLNSLHWARQLLCTGYLAQALLLTRSAMEDWGTTVYVKHHPEKAPLWLERPDHDIAKWAGPSFADIWTDAFSDGAKDEAEEAVKKTKAMYGALSLFAHPRAAGLSYLVTFDSEQTFFHVGPPKAWDVNQFETGLYFLLNIVQAFFSTVDTLVFDTTGEADEDWRAQGSELSIQILQRLALIENRVMNRVEQGLDSEEADPN